MRMVQFLTEDDRRAVAKVDPAENRLQVLTGAESVRDLALEAGLLADELIPSEASLRATLPAFTRDPASGEKLFYGEWLPNAQGEDVVAGIRMTKDISQLRDEMPAAYKEFEDIADRLEKHYREMQDVEFTIEKEKLWMLQTRDGKRTAQAAVRIAVDMVEEGLARRDISRTGPRADECGTLPR